jgi:hypothetical protein
MTPALKGFLRGLGAGILTSTVTYFANPASWVGIVPAGIATLLSAVALAIEHDLTAPQS